MNEARRRVLQIAVPAAVLGIAAATRLIGLEQPGELVFDETYYVKDAESLRQLGYEGRWPDGADALWAAGTPGSPSDLASFVAHPPLGKWVIALGLAALGPENPAGWRLGTALTGIALVGLVMLLAHLLLGRLVLTGIAGLLIAVDGNAIVMSRVALLDGVLALLVVLAVTLMVLDRRQVRDELDAWMLARRSADPPRSTDWGPALWGRPWLVAAGVAFGLAVGVKWSALYLLAAFAVLTVVADAVERRRAGVALWASGTLLRQAPISFVLMIPSAAAAHVLTWWGWFATTGGYGRTREVTDENRLPGILGSLPDALQNWWEYQTAIYGYHVGVTGGHNYEAPAIGWPLLLRPTYMHYRDLGDGTAEAITGIPNPLIWWGAVLAVVAIVVVLIVQAVLRRRGRARTLLPASGWAIAVVLTGVGAGWLPWLLYPERTMFFFYTIVITPFLVLALTIALGALLPRTTQPDAEPEPADPARRAAGLVIVIGLLVVIVAVSVFFLPLWTGVPTPIDQIRLRYWMPTWI
ncbi:dolichyl-phosphate-mannose--protein mannosyltransferase [Microcella humidisoli]|uniref:Polyprenol-phosphate-mannose--protein mannosyltransferase n=1 Tax=Microcella humidisoli TaxID=2963406 RepID=A0ABY5FY33_9MICO|nr:phospholipid carrier-dependent glycosyltransferase [Microcella humidisoli]UTT62973.1 phospholipid carrier-dependent glycosyltransferase [Microcella humidisoli]